MRYAGTILMTMLAAGSIFAVEEAEYEVITEDGRFEIRDYEPYILAEIVITNSTLESAGNAAFRPLFNYISGANTTEGKIEMTAPVSQEKKSVKIDMTAPVSQEESDEGWAVSFMMPASNTLATLPAPENNDIKLREVPARRMASVSYSGRWTENKYDKYLEKLQEWMDKEGHKSTGNPIWARYNPPFTLWFLRRNEILIPVKNE